MWFGDAQIQWPLLWSPSFPQVYEGIHFLIAIRSLSLSHFIFWEVEWKSPLIPAFPSLKHWLQTQPSQGSPCDRSRSFCLASQLRFFDILRSQPVIVICCCIPDWNLCAMIFINPFHWFCYFYLLGHLLLFWVLFNIVNATGTYIKGMDGRYT